MILRCFVLMGLLTLLVSCAEIAVKSTTPFQLSGRDFLYDKTNWSFSGRLAMSDENDSLTGSISWIHRGNADDIELSGPFGQGRTRFLLTKEHVLIDDGDTRLHYHENADDLLAKQWGIKIPVLALKYWVLGLPEPEHEYLPIDRGFAQSGWDVVFLEMQDVKQIELPKKIKITHNNAKLKLIINQWEF